MNGRHTIAMDDPAAVHELYEIGRRAAEKQVKLEHLIG